MRTLEPLVTAEDVKAADEGYAGQSCHYDSLRAALEAYGRRLLGRLAECEQTQWGWGPEGRQWGPAASEQYARSFALRNPESRVWSRVVYVGPWEEVDSGV